MAAEDYVGRVLDRRYRILEYIGSGGMSLLFRAVHVGTGRTLAVKVLRPDFQNNLDFVRRFQREAWLTAKLQHESVVDILDVQTEGDCYLVMEYLIGVDLRVHLRQVGRLSWPRVREIMLQVCGALDCAHANGVVHRDLKPANIFQVEDSGRIKVLDFGIAKPLSPLLYHGGRITVTGALFGTPEYMAPEQFCGQADQQSDIYSAGVLMFELLTGRRPFRAKGAELLHQVVNQAPPSFASVTGIHDWPAGLERVVQRALAKLPDGRYPSMGAFAEAIAAGYLSEDGTEEVTRERAASAGIALPDAPEDLVGRSTRPMVGARPLAIVVGGQAQSGLPLAPVRTSVELSDESMTDALERPGVAISMVHARVVGLPPDPAVPGDRSIDHADALTPEPVGSPARGPAEVEGGAGPTPPMLAERNSKHTRKKQRGDRPWSAVLALLATSGLVAWMLLSGDEASPPETGRDSSNSQVDHEVVPASSRPTTGAASLGVAKAASLSLADHWTVEHLEESAGVEQVDLRREMPNTEVLPAQEVPPAAPTHSPYSDTTPRHDGESEPPTATRVRPETQSIERAKLPAKLTPLQRRRLEERLEEQVEKVLHQEEVGALVSRVTVSMKVRADGIVESVDLSGLARGPEKDRVVAALRRISVKPEPGIPLSIDAQFDHLSLKSQLSTQ